MKRIALTALMAALLSAVLGTANAVPVPAAAVQTWGRIAAGADGWRATWPGSAWTLRFAGSAIAVRLDDAVNHWVLEIDGRPALQIAPAAAGERSVWLRGLPPGEHLARLVKRTESPAQAARVIGFELGDGGQVLPAPPRPPLRIEFLGDSYTAALGNLSTTRRCGDEAETAARTDITQGFAVLAARALGAEWRIEARTGAGLVRNWNGSRPGETFFTDHGRLLQSDAGSRFSAGDDGWVPSIVVIGLGTNDLSTPLRADEAGDEAGLDRAVRAAYRELLAGLHRRYGEPRLVLLSVGLPHGDRQRALVEDMLAEQRAAGHRAERLDWGPLSATGCGSHPDREDHRRMGERLLELLLR